MNPIAKELNEILEKENPHVLSMLSSVGKNLFFPKGILSQSAEAKQKAHRFNATIGIATEGGKPLHLPSIMGFIKGISPEQCLTYAPSFGLPELRKTWKASLFDKNPSLAGVKISTPVVTQALTHGIAVMGDMWLDPGDVVILPKIFWGNYGLILSVRRGARFSHYNLFSEQGGLDLASFEACVREEASKNEKITVLLNFPQNPTGYTATKAEGKKIADILLSVAEGGTNVVVVCDDAYFGLFYDPDCLQESVFALLAQKHERLCAIKLCGATKEDFVWGLRVGFITYGVKFAGNDEAAYEALEKKTAGAVRGSISNASHLSQTIVQKAMQSPTYAVEKAAKREILKARALKVKEVLKDPAYADAWEPYPFNSGYFMCLRLKTVDAEPLRVHLLDNYGVGLISLGKSELRVAFSCLEEEHVKELFDTVLAGVRDLERAA